MRLIAIAGFLLIFGIVASPVSARPNVVVFLVDDLGVMDTSLTTAEEGFYETPHLERLAARGTVFSNGYCAHPRCLESRYGIQTGRAPYRDRMIERKVGAAMADQTLLGEAFQEAGYATGFFGKWHLGHDETEWPHGRGWSVNIGGCHAGAVGSQFAPYHLDARSGKPGKEGPLFGLEQAPEGENITDRLTGETVSWIRSHHASQPDQPFFAFLSHFAVHTPIQGKPEEIAHFKIKVASLPVAEGTGGYLDADGSSKSRRDHPDYASMIKTTDDSLGSILDLLEELAIADNSIVLFTSDHGGLSNRSRDSKRELATSNFPYRAGKGHLYEGGLRVPFLIAYPARFAGGQTSEDWAIGTDIFPTLLDLAGLELQPSQHLDGISLAPALSGHAVERDRYFWHHPRPRPTQTGDKACSVLRLKNFKLLKTYFPAVGYELYDLDLDPYEKADLAATKPERVVRMAEILQRQLTKAKAADLRADWKLKDHTAPVATPPQ